MLSDAYEAARILSERLGDPPRVIAARGGCGSGKTFTLRSLYGELGIFDKHGDLPGAVKPDYFKMRILEEGERQGVDLISDQTHVESTGMSAMFMRLLMVDPSQSLIIDKQLEAANDIPELVEQSRNAKKPLELIDTDAPIELLAYRVLRRPVGGADPNIGFDRTAIGFMGIRNHRAATHAIVRSDPVVTKYSLHVFDPSTKQQVEIATKWNDEITVREGFEALARNVVYQPMAETRREIDQAGTEVITEEYRDYFVRTYFDDTDRGQWLAQEAWQIFSAYVGLDMTIKEAMRSKADGIEVCPRNPRFANNFRDQLTVWKKHYKAKNNVD